MLRGLELPLDSLRELEGLICPASPIAGEKLIYGHLYIDLFLSRVIDSRLPMYEPVYASTRVLFFHYNRICRESLAIFTDVNMKGLQKMPCVFLKK